MKGDEGPYINDQGDVWVPRTVPYLEARKIAKTGDGAYYGQRFRYIGKDDAELVGFTRDCDCEEVCSGGPVVEWDATALPECTVPAWHFRIEDTA